MRGHAQLAYEQYVERRAERGRDLERDGDTATRDAEDQRITRAEVFELLGELTPGVASIGERQCSVTVGMLSR